MLLMLEMQPEEISSSELFAQKCALNDGNATAWSWEVI